jgi:hypothetical protein
VNKEEVPAHTQREENNVLLRSLVGLSKIIGGAVVLLLLSGILAAIIDHIKLAEVAVKLDALALAVASESASQRALIVAISQRVTLNETAIVEEKATVLALDGRVLSLERAHHAK